jgi:hypothetical protein
MNAILTPHVDRRIVHGHSGTPAKRSPTYISWAGMVQRTTNFGHKSFLDYADRGVDPSFLGKGGFVRFLAEVGVRPSREHTLDRIDNAKGYVPGNMRWATKPEQEQNKDHPRYYGRTSEEWARLLGVKPTTIRKRRERGWPDYKVFPVEYRLPEAA